MIALYFGSVGVRKIKSALGIGLIADAAGMITAIVLGLMRSNVWLTGGSMLAGKTLRYIVVLATFEGAASLF